MVDASRLTVPGRAALNDKDEPDLCPEPVPDRGGIDADGNETERGAKYRIYEDHIKKLVNPGNPTPSGMGYVLPNPQDGGNPVYFDDCQHSTGMLVEVKGTTYGRLLERIKPESLQALDRMLNQATRQVQAKQERELSWFFAEKEVADVMQERFSNSPDLNVINVIYEPME